MKTKRVTSYALHAVAYMSKHITQLPVTAEEIANREGISSGYMLKIFKRLCETNILRQVDGGYVFARDPHDISMLELLKATEGEALFDECFMKHCDCKGTKENCRIFASWEQSTRQMKKLLSDMSIDQAAWHHPDHRLNEIEK